MNFKFTRLKTIIALILGVIMGYFFKYECVGECSDYLLRKIEFHLIGFVIAFALVYVVWSLVQKKNKK